MKIRKGDTVRLKPVQVINVDNSGLVYASFGGILGAIAFRSSTVESIVPAPLKVGDVVRHKIHPFEKTCSAVYRIVAIEDGQAALVGHMLAVAPRWSLLAALTRIED